ncbi:MAG TPA: VOC family protein [Balneolaceae bacterium]|nr:VOC family protein [Balneolaceae bacterium]
MISRMSHTIIYVPDQVEAYDFYVNKLGLEVREDSEMGEGMRWLTVGAKDQPDMEITLMPAQAGMSLDQEQAKSLQKLIKSGAFGFGIFECDNIYTTYKELKKKGVTFRKAPKEEFYGIEAIFEDPFGNWFSLGQKE